MVSCLYNSTCKDQLTGNVISSRLLLSYTHASSIDFNSFFAFRFSSLMQHFFMDAEMKEVVDPVTDDDVRCGAGTKGRHLFPSEYFSVSIKRLYAF